MRSLHVELDGPVHYADFGGSGRPLVLVHGLGGSHLNWLAVGPRLAERHRVLAVDLGGHGRTPSGLRDASVRANRRLLGRFLEKVVGERAVLVGNSMGGFLAIAEAAREPERVSGLVLVAPAVPLARGARLDARVLALFAGLALPFVGTALIRRRARRGPEQSVRDLLALCCVDPSRIAADVLEAHVALARERAMHGAAVGDDFLSAARSLTVALARRAQFFERVRAVKAPALIVQGANDRLVRVEAARALAAARPDWRLEVLDDVGHVPQLEAPERFLAVVEPWLAAPTT